MTTPTPQRISVTQGEAVAIRLPIVDDATGLPLVLTGAAITFTIAPTVGGVPLATRSTSNGGITIGTTDAANDTAVISLLPATTNALRGEYGWEVALGGATPGVVARGAISITASTTLQA